MKEEMRKVESGNAEKLKPEPERSGDRSPRRPNLRSEGGGLLTTDDPDDTDKGRGQLVSSMMMYSPGRAFWTISAMRGAKGSRSGQRLVGNSMMAMWRPSIFC